MPISSKTREAESALPGVENKTKLFHQAMETTLQHILLEEYDCIPALRMIRMTAREIRERSRRFGGTHTAKSTNRVRWRFRDWRQRYAGTDPADLSDRDPKRKTPLPKSGGCGPSDPPIIIARIERDRVVLDLRTVLPEDEEALVRALM